MAQTKPKFMLIEHGRYFYQRKVPIAVQSVVGRKKWRAPLGNDFDDAYDRLKHLRDEHDALLKRIEDPDEKQKLKTQTRRTVEQNRYENYFREDEAYEKWCHAQGLKTETEEYLQEEARLLAAGLNEELPVWEDAARWIAAIDHERENPETSVLHDFPMDDDEYHDQLKGVLDRFFGDTVVLPKDPEDRDEFDAAKLKLERKIARVAKDPDTVSKVARKFFGFADLREKTEHKYRRTMERLIAEFGDIPISQVTPRMLRDYRDKLKLRGLLPSSIRAEFTPIMGLFGYAVDEELIEISPMVSVKLPKERRAVEEMKWLPFDAKETLQIFAALDEVWGQKVRGLSEERRKALCMAVRVLAFTAMRPAELMALRPDQVDERAIRVEGGKTKSSWRVIPLHPEISDFPAWLHAGGLSAFNNSKTGKTQTDTVTVLRHNFSRLIRKKMTEPINEPRKALYSLRSTFQNAMRRAGAPKDVRRAILGHVESGAIRHYDDGPSFDLLKKWVENADPRRP
ncbi:tyrosine-type recombinase/integrase [Rhodobacteraceae bacterium]|nr:tyrosine-type recombinase/integrase [Paracoccaceae bacterium]